MKALLISETNSWDVSYGHSARKVLELLGTTDSRHHFTEKRRRQAENKYLILQKNH